MSQRESTRRGTGDRWRSKLGMVLVAAGVPIGLGSMLQVVTLAGKHGGGAFLLVYLVSLILVGMPVLLAELVIGRRSQASAADAFGVIRSTPATTWNGVGALAVLCSLTLLSMQGVVAGGVLDLAMRAIEGTLDVSADEVDDLAALELLYRAERDARIAEEVSLADQPGTATGLARAAIDHLQWRIAILESENPGPEDLRPPSNLKERAEALETGGSAPLGRLASTDSACASLLEGRTLLSGSSSGRDEVLEAREAFHVAAIAFESHLAPLVDEVDAWWTLAGPTGERLEELRRSRADRLLEHLEGVIEERASLSAQKLELARSYSNRRASRRFESDRSRVLTCHGIFVAIAVLIVGIGLRGGVERLALVPIPVLLAFLLALCVRAVTLEDRGAGLELLFRPVFSSLTLDGVLVAGGHAVLTLGVGMGVMLTCGSYLPGEDNLNVSVVLITGVNALMTLLAAIAIFVSMGALGVESIESTSALLFHVLPVLFAEMPAGGVWGALFFSLLALTTLVSTVALLEVVARFAIDKWGWSRWFAAVTGGMAAGLVGLLPIASLSGSLPLDSIAGLEGSVAVDEFLAHICAAWLVPLGALFVSLFVGWAMPSWQKQEEVRYGPISGSLYYVWDHVMLKFVAPAALVLYLLGRLELLAWFVGWTGT